MMDIRNAAWSADGTQIDCEVDHPQFGWIPFTASDQDTEELGRDVFQAALELIPAPYVAPVIDPAVALAAERADMKVTRLQAIAALYHAGLLDMVKVYMTKADFLTQLAWNEAADFNRTSALVESIGAALALSDDALDELFRTGATIEF